MPIRILSASDFDRAIDAASAVDAMRSAFAQISTGRARVPVRLALESERGTTLLMPAWLAGSAELGAKIVSVFPDNPHRGHPPIHGAVLLLEADTGRPRALLDGTRLTAVRTAAGSALATELLADPTADVLAVFGAGVQARAHIELISRTRPLREIRIVARSLEAARRVAGELVAGPPLVPPGADDVAPTIRAMDDRDRAVAGAGIVVAATPSSSPVFDGARLEAGTHVNGIGSYRPDMQEVDETTVLRARVVVDQRDAAWEEAGDLIIPLERGIIGRDAIDAELGEIVSGLAERGACGREITFFKSVGNAAQDVAIASAAIAVAEAEGLGVEVALTGC